MDSGKNQEFDRSVRKKFNVYNSLIRNLNYDMIEKVAVMLPIINQKAQKGLEEGREPIEILDEFFSQHTSIQNEKDKLDFMFKVIQYVERQVVLYDSVEDAAFPSVREYLEFFSITDFFQLLDGEKNWDKITDKLSNFSARIVLTAHPTQFYPPAVLNIMNQLREEIKKNDINEIDKLVHQLGLTSLINSDKPTPLDEAKNIIYLLRHIYYDAIGDFYSMTKKNLKDRDFNNPDIIKLGFWPGGDRDGNPFVTADITMDVADQLRMTLMKCYYADAKYLENKLTFRKTDVIIKKLRVRLYAALFNKDEMISYDEIIDPLLNIKDLLKEEYYNLYSKELEKLIDKVRIFKTHFAALDIRQDHSIHEKIITEILIREGRIKNDLGEMNQDDLINLLVKEDLSISPEQFDDPVFRDTIVNISQLKLIQLKNGEEGCNRYIISNSESPNAVLFVYALFRWCGWKSKKLTFDIIPLFETMKGMESSEETMEALFSVEEYRNHIAKRGNKQTIMLGFSDGTKDGGYLQANWSIFKTKENLSKVCEQNNVKSIFFDGRGGPPGRGGGKSHRFYAAQSPQIANNEIQLTIQGQTITSTYGTSEQFIHHCEQLLTAGLYKNFFGNENRLSESTRTLIEELAKISYEKYISLKEHPLFIPYLEKMSTLKYYGKTKIGSRPGKRGKKKQLELNDLRAISFVGSWSQLKQNIPGYFGIGSAIFALKEQGRMNELKKLFHEVPFFKALILNSMMSLSKCNFDLTSFIRKDKEFGPFWDILYAEYSLSREMELEISGYNELMEEEMISQKSISIRENIVLPLLLIQQYAMQKMTLDPQFKEVYEKIITRSLYGNINASRNSA